MFHDLGLIERWGSGVQRMMAACHEAGLPQPVLEEIATRFRVTLSAERSGPPVLDDKDRAILDSLRDGEGLLTSQIADVIGLSSRATRTRLSKLVERGLVRDVGTSPQDPKRRYFAAE